MKMKMNIILVFLTFLLLKLTSGFKLASLTNKTNRVFMDETDPRCLIPYCHCKSSFSSLLCDNFTSFNQLDFKRTNKIQFDDVELTPLIDLSLNESLNLDGLYVAGTLILNRIISLNPFYNPFKDVTVKTLLNLYIVNSTIDYYTNIPSLILQSYEFKLLEACQYSSSNLNELIFSNLILNELRFMNVKFNHNLCPIIFKSSNINRFNIINPLGTLFGFMDLYFTPDIVFVSQEYPLRINIERYILSFRDPIPINSAVIMVINSINTLNRHLLQYTKIIELNKLKQVNRIDEATFKNLKYLKQLEFYDMNLKNILLNTRKWLLNLNVDEVFDIDKNQLIAANFDRNRIFKLFIEINSFWQFNTNNIESINDNICLFKYFKHNKLVYPLMLYSDTHTKCTCVIYWLYKYIDQYKYIYQLSSTFMPLHCFQNVNYTNEISKCQFDTTFNQCVDFQEPITPTTTRVTITSPTIFTVSSFTFSSITTKSTDKPSSSSLLTSNPSFSTASTSKTSSYFASSTVNHLLDGDSRTNDLIKQSRINFYIAISLLIIIVLIIIILIILFYKTFILKPKTVNTNDNKKSTTIRSKTFNYRNATQTSFQTPSSTSSIDIE